MRFWSSLILAGLLTLLCIGAVAAAVAEPIGTALLHWAVDGSQLFWSGVRALAVLVSAILLLLLTIAVFFSLWCALFILFAGRTKADAAVLGQAGATHGDKKAEAHHEKKVEAHRVRKRDRPYWADGTSEHRGSLGAFIKQHQDFLATRDQPNSTGTELRIGIVLAGGGAKGVYQAGALRALWEFLEEQKAIEFVRVIAGTSIGSWNSVFWLDKKVGNGDLQRWWLGARTSRVVGPGWYIPVVRNFIATTDPWHADFRARFSNFKLQKFPFCYFTRTNVGTAELEMTTNRTHRPGRQDYRDLSNDKPCFAREIASEELEAAVFASMDIPPLLARIKGAKGQRYEDGGVVDNLPVRYATWYEGCNLLFVFPLNASFRQKPSDWGLLARLMRVNDIRQGVLEHDALTEIGLYNYVVRAAPNMMPAGMPEVKLNFLTKPQPIQTREVTTFCICPDQPLDVETAAFWNLRRYAAQCEERMYEVTLSQLTKFDFSTTNHEVWMAKVPPRKADVTYTDFSPVIEDSQN